MTPKPNVLPSEKSGLHPRNRHRTQYDFPQLVQCSPPLAAFVARNAYGDQSIDFANPDAVTALNRALLKSHYGIAHWDIPPGYLCPPIPGRADYIHRVAALLSESNGGAIPRGDSVMVIDIGIGANCIYPIVGRCEFGWRFIGTDVDPVALHSAEQIISANPSLKGGIECRLQPSPENIFKGIVRRGEFLDFCVCNPPFHSSPEEAAAGSQRKVRNLSGGKIRRPILNFGGRSTELWCNGGELAFARRMIRESARLATRCLWFSILLSKQSHLPAALQTFRSIHAKDVRTIEMSHGQKKSRIIAWTFLPPDQRRAHPRPVRE